MNFSKNLIGFGSYGYIFYPPLDFSDDTIDINKNDNYITKLLLIDDAEREIENQKLINNIDTNNEYHLGKYYMTKSMSKNIKIHNLELFKNNKLSDLCLIIQKYGGIDLFKCFNKKTKLNDDEYKLFLVELFRILEGIKLLEKNDLLHHDINPKNVLYKKDCNKLNYIDFSLTNKKEIIIKESINSTYEFSIFHSSFPIESGFYNKKSFDEIKLWNNEYINEYCKELKRIIIFDLNNYETSIIKSLKELFYFYYVIDKKLENKEIKIEAINKINKFLLTVKNNSYECFLKKSLETFDLYGYGLCLLYTLRFCDIYLTDELSEELYELALNMADLNVFTRLTIETAQEKFKNILVKYNIIKL